MLKRMETKTISFALLLIMTLHGSNGQNGDGFQLQRPGNLPSINDLEVMCGKDYLTVQLSFTAPFQGMVFSKGQYSQRECLYVQPRSNLQNFEFKISYDKCGTKPDMGGRFYENTIIIQYDSDLIEVWDEAKRLRCEWYNDYEKTASKPPMVIADLDVIELNFRGDNVDCWMEIQDGKGPWASPVTGIVPLGSTLTMVIAINDLAGEFDMRVKSCEASDGINPPIFLSDEKGCVLRTKMITKFMKLRNNDGRATVITYAHFHAFKFPDSMTVNLRCKVEICRFGCPDHCQDPIAGNPSENYQSIARNVQDNFGSGSERQKTVVKPQPSLAARLNNSSVMKSFQRDTPRLTNYEKRSQYNRRLPDVIADRQAGEEYLKRFYSRDGEEVIELPNTEDFPYGPRSLRRKRYAIHNRHVRSAELGVTSNLQVISEADLEFTPIRDEGVTVFQGHRESIVYGICLPAPGFSALFVLLAMCTVISVLVAGFMCHHRQIQKDKVDSPATPHPHSPFAMVHFLRAQLMGHVL